MSLRLVPDNEGPRALGPASTDASPRPASQEPKRPTPLIVAPKGALPLELARGLQNGEPVIWWGEKSQLRWSAVAGLSLIGLGALAFLTLLVPEFWEQPWRQWAQGVAATQLPAALFLGREFKGRRVIAVTDNAVLDLDPKGGRDRIGFRTIREVRRDWLSGGVRLVGVQHEVRIPPALMADAREAIASQTEHMLDMSKDPPKDHLSWFPWPGRS